MKNAMDEYQIPRERMIRRLREHYKIKDERVLEVMNQIPRHMFVPEAIKFQAYKDNALPISNKQTISQPYIVAKMTELLEILPTHKILEIGAGSGYQTIVLSQLAGKIYSIERVENLAQKTKARLHNFNIPNVSLKCDDGTNGWPEYSPYDGILVAAGSPAIPKPLLEQLKPDGKLVIPIGDDAKSQKLYRITRTENGFSTEDFGKCSFVPLIGDHGWRD
jgi:protein-L-isoaspartate(D-aspartate) O-methyltransferase